MSLKILKFELLFFTSGPKNYSMEWNGMWNKKKLMEWNGNGMKIDKTLWNGMEVE